HRAPILVALALADHDDVVAAVEVLDPELEALQEPEPRAILQQRDEPIHAAQLGDDALNFLPGKDHWEPFGSFGANDAFELVEGPFEHRAVKKQQGIERLILRRGADVSLDSQ